MTLSSSTFYFRLIFFLFVDLISFWYKVLLMFKFFCLGYMCSPAVLDKDGVSAAVIAAEMSSFLATKNLSLSQQLKAVYEE